MLSPLPLLKALTIRKTLIAVFFIVGVALTCWIALRPDEEISAHLNDAYGKLPLQFEPNEGQAAPDVEFLTRGSDYTLFLKQTEAVLSLRKQDVRLKVLGGNPAARISALDVLPGKVNHFRGNDPAKWRTNISTYKKVKYESVYPGIDLVYYGDQGRLEYDFIVAPRIDPQLIQLSFPEAKALRIDQEGALIVKVQDVELRQPKPLIYQETTTGRRIIGGSYVIKGSENFAFQIGDYDRNEPLIIDPTLMYSTLLGTSTARSIAVDDAGNAYITGQIDSDVYVLKLNPSGTALIYAALVGGTQDEEGVALELDSGGNAYVTGRTSSTNFPTVNAIQPAHQGTDTFDAFVFKLNSSGSALSYSTYLGGNGFDGGSAIAVNSAGNAFITGSTSSTNFPVANALQPAKGPGIHADAFISKFTPTGNALVYSTYLGGSNSDFASGAVLDSADNFYITGTTQSSDFPATVNARQSVLRGFSDVFVSKLNSSGSALVYSTYHGGGGPDEGVSIGVDSTGSICVTGFTNSSDFPLANALDSTFNNFDGFVTKFNSEGDGFIYSTFLGGDRGALPLALTLDSSGNVYITGDTSSADFPLVQPLQKSLAGGDIFVAKLNPAGSALLFSTYLGSRTSDRGHAIAVRNGSIFVVGNTFGAPDFPVTPGAFQQNHFEEDGSIEGFAFKIDSGTNTNYYSISGRVSLGPLGLSEILVTLNGSTSRRVRTDSDGRYSFHTLIEGGTYTVTAVPSSQFSFSPPSRTFANLNADQTNANFIVPGPPNDFFSNAQVISDTSGVINGTNAGATVEPGEALSGFASVWYRWQAPTTGSVMLNYTPSQSGMLLEVFTGSSVASLTNVSARFTDCEFIGCNQSAASFKSVAGTVYFIRVATVGSSGTFGFSFAPGGPAISGRVKNVNGRSLSGFSVRATILGQNKVATATTSENGYSLVLPSGGNYSVVAVSPFGLPIPIGSFVPVQFNNLMQDVPNVDFTVSGPTVNIGGSIVIVNGTSTGVSVTATGVGTTPRPCDLFSSVSFISFTCAVPIFGDYTITPSSANHTFNPTSLSFVEVSQGTNSASFSGTEIPKAPLQLMVENPGPVPDLVLALDAALLVREPFSLINPLNWMNTGSDKNTRLVIFLQNFRPVSGEHPSEVVVNIASNSQSFDVFAEDVRPLANTDLVQVTFRLPNQLLPADYVVKVRAHGETTNTGTLRISP